MFEVHVFVDGTKIRSIGCSDGRTFGMDNRSHSPVVRQDIVDALKFALSQAEFDLSLAVDDSSGIPDCTTTPA